MDNIADFDFILILAGYNNLELLAKIRPKYSLYMKKRTTIGTVCLQLLNYRLYRI